MNIQELKPEDRIGYYCRPGSEKASGTVESIDVVKKIVWVKRKGDRGAITGISPDDIFERKDPTYKQFDTYKAPVLPDDPDKLRAFALKTHTELHARTQQRDNLAKHAEQLSKDLNTIEYDEILKRERAEHDIRIRQQWRMITSEANACMSRLLGQWPSPVDTRVFDADDWDRGHELKRKLLRVIEEWDNTRLGSDSMIIDASSRFAMVPCDSEE